MADPERTARGEQKSLARLGEHLLVRREVLDERAAEGHDDRILLCMLDLAGPLVRGTAVDVAEGEQVALVEDGPVEHGRCPRIAFPLLP